MHHICRFYTVSNKNLIICTPYIAYPGAPVIFKKHKEFVNKIFVPMEAAPHM